MKTITSISLVILAVLVFGCTTTSRHALVGQWKSVNNPDEPTFELFEDGRLVWGVDDGSWTVLDDGKLQLNVPFCEEPVESEFSIDGDKVTLTYADGGTEEFMRVK